MKEQKEINLEMQIILLGDKLRNANNIVSKVIDGKYTKTETQRMLMEVKRIVAEVQTALIG